MAKSKPSTSDIRAGAVLYAMRNYRRLSQSDVADCLGVSFQQIQKYEKGRSSMRIETLERLAEILEIPVMAFFKEMDTAQISMLALDRDEIRLLQLWRRMPDEGRRKNLLGLVEVW